jgi:hypothetical protein
VIRQVEEGAVDAVALSASVAADPRRLAAEAAAVGEACGRSGVPLVVGGRGPWPERLAHGQLVRSFEGLRRWMEEIEGG